MMGVNIASSQHCSDCTNPTRPALLFNKQLTIKFSLLSGLPEIWGLPSASYVTNTDKLILKEIFLAVSAVWVAVCKTWTLDFNLLSFGS